MIDNEIYASFDSEETARDVSKALNAWFHWIVEGDQEDCPEVFENFGVTTEDYWIDREEDVDWEDPPRVRVNGAGVLVTFIGDEASDTINELLEALGAYDISEADDETMDAFDNLDDEEDDLFSSSDDE